MGAVAVSMFPVLATSADLAATEPDAAAGRINSDPMYLPLANHFYGETSYSYENDSSTDTYLGGAALATGYNHSSSVQQLVGWGVTDDFTVRLIDNYASQGSTTEEASSGRRYWLGDDGLQNPTASATWRIIDQRANAPVSVDATLKYSPNWIGSHIAAIGKNGTEGSGRQEGSAALALGRVMPRFTVRGQLEAVYLGNRQFEYLANGTTAQGSSYWNYIASVSAQFRLSATVSLGGGYAYTITETENITNVTPGLTGQIAGGNSGDLSATVDYQFVPYRLIGQIGYHHIQYAGMTISYPGEPANDYMVSRNANQISARLYYAF